MPGGPKGEDFGKSTLVKAKKRELYHDKQVQGTNDYSIVSKRSVEKFYTSKLNPECHEWFKHVVAEDRRRSPSINRGYWIRMESIRRFVDNIIESRDFSDQKISIINLGCGYDTLPFQLLGFYKKQGNGINLEFIDIDYPDLLKKKLQLVKSSEEMMSLIGDDNMVLNQDNNFDIYLFSSNNYKLVACDLKNEKLYEQMLNNLGAATIKIFISEVSLAYMKPEHADSIISCSSKIPNSHFLILEQILPCGRFHFFAQKMLYHFAHLGSPLNCVETYPSKEHQIDRFKQFYSNAEVRDLFEIWNELVDLQTKKKVKEVEDFDEWEEFIVFCQHYTLLHANNRGKSFYNINTPEMPEIESIDRAIKIKTIASNDNHLKKKFSSACFVDNELLLFGGAFQTRVNDLVSISVNEQRNTRLIHVEGSIPRARMAHTLTEIDDKSCILIGGRSSPSVYLKDSYIFRNNEWLRLPDMKEGRRRHSCVKVNSSQFLIFGGLKDDHGAGASAFIMYDSFKNDFIDMDIQGSIPNLSSCGMYYDGISNIGYICGGMSNDIDPQVSDALYTFEVLDGNVIKIEITYKHAQFRRIGPNISLLSDGRLLIVGGVSPLKLLNQFNTVVTYNIKSKVFEEVEVTSEVWKDSPPLFIGFSMAKTPHSVICVGGGAVCYSFGSAYSSTYEISYTDKQHWQKSMYFK
ncbi:Piso0_004794 [Millerozyma farinosa CBS 7064]|uniref:tRNA wybutosine-synthesizing protein 4 n=1 Tax=Pichia sorbitophila (strain ATCC MYA-4447 / BCRC 22081 / CBS 7064 / NBRC 10061 / NRRL Y-12695) TaxID=559304 RepID=G8Y3E4_PICSO|nr:Piso0_004794 [Millerozyma farinosa CBS 7064]